MPQYWYPVNTVVEIVLILLHCNKTNQSFPLFSLSIEHIHLSYSFTTLVRSTCIYMYIKYMYRYMYPGKKVHVNIHKYIYTKYI